MMAIWSSGAGAAPIIIGLDADVSGALALSGEAIRRGAVLGIEEVNAQGGVLNRELALRVMDHRGIPDRGLDNINALGTQPDVVAVIGGVHTTVALHEMAAIHRHRLIYLGAWAAGTAIVDNGYQPNYVFRVSVRDALAGAFMVQHAVESGFRRIALLLERTAWGTSNNKGMGAAAQILGARIVGVEWFNRGTADLGGAVRRLLKANAQGILLVSVAKDGATAVRGMVAQPPGQRQPILSHWGITGGDFVAIAGYELLQQVDLQVLQTFSLLHREPNAPRQRLYKRYQKSFPEVTSPRGVFAPVGMAHAYDLVHLLAKAIRLAGTTDRSRVRDALERLPAHQGAVRRYHPAFTPSRHDALTEADYTMARFERDGAIVPVKR